MKKESGSKFRCFIAVPLKKDFPPVLDAIRKGIHEAGGSAISEEDQLIFRGNITEYAQGAITGADCIVADLSERDPNVYFEIGLAQAMGKGVFLCARRGTNQPIPFDLNGNLFDVYDLTHVGLARLSSRIAESLKQYRRLPRILPAARASAPFSINWDLLERPEAENLCRELIEQMGYQRVDWWQESPEIDLVADLPKKDPDGFEYAELWLISMGRHAPPEMLLEWAEHGPDFLFHRILRRVERFAERMSRMDESAPITLLLILLTGEPSVKLRERIEMRFGRRSSHKEGLRESNVRIRVWDRPYLTSLVQQFPQLGYKYFSDEGRAQSKYRKTPEELNKENVDLSARLVQAIHDLEDEKNLRVRAERDAVWKDISFSAAHKIGNPIFAIETNLDPLDKRVRESRISEALEVVGSIRSSVEKAKAIIDQFKSLTKAQEIKPVMTPLEPILQEAARQARAHGVNCMVECPTDLQIYADPDRLAECFDELTVNATHWFDKPEKILRITASLAVTVPTILDSSRQYLVIHVRDNGKGVATENKERIFDAFFTTQSHGTGLGLALVRRIVEGHGGMVAEIGTPGEGADFEIYLPRAMSEQKSVASLSPSTERMKPRAKVKNKKPKTTKRKK